MKRMNILLTIKTNEIKTTDNIQPNFGVSFYNLGM